MHRSVHISVVITIFLTIFTVPTWTHPGNRVKASADLGPDVHERLRRSPYDDELSSISSSKTSLTSSIQSISKTSTVTNYSPDPLRKSPLKAPLSEPSEVPGGRSNSYGSPLSTSDRDSDKTEQRPRTVQLTAALKELNEYLRSLRIKRTAGPPKISCHKISREEADARNRIRALVLPESDFFKPLHRKTLLGQSADDDRNTVTYAAKPREVLGIVEDIFDVLSNIPGVVGGTGTDVVADFVEASKTNDGIMTPIIVDDHDGVGLIVGEKIFEADAYLEVVPHMAKIMQLREVAVQRGSIRKNGRKTFERTKEDVIECEEDLEVDRVDDRLSEERLYTIIIKHEKSPLPSRVPDNTNNEVDIKVYVSEKSTGIAPDVDPEEEDPTPIKNELNVEFTKQKLRKAAEDRRRAAEDIEIRDRIEDSRRAAERSRMEILKLEEERAKLESVRKFQDIARQNKLALEAEIESKKHIRTIQDEERIRKIRTEEEDITRIRKNEDLEIRSYRDKGDQDRAIKHSKEEDDLKIRLKVQNDKVDLTKTRVDQILANRRKQEDDQTAVNRRVEDEVVKAGRRKQEDDIVARRRKEDEEIIMRRKAEDDMRSAMRAKEDNQAKARRAYEDDETAKRRAMEDQQEYERHLIERAELDEVKRAIEQDILLKRQKEDRQRLGKIEAEDAALNQRRKNEDEIRRSRITTILEEIERSRIIEDQTFTHRLKIHDDELENARLKEEKAIIENINRLKELARIEIAKRYAERERAEFASKRLEREKADASLREEEAAKIDALVKIIDAREKVLELRRMARLRDIKKDDDKKVIPISKPSYIREQTEHTSVITASSSSTSLRERLRERPSAVQEPRNPVKPTSSPRCVRRAAQVGSAALGKPSDNSGSRLKLGFGTILDNLIMREKAGFEPSLSLGDPGSRNTLAPILDVVGDSVPASSLKSLSVKSIHTIDGDAIGLTAGNNIFVLKVGNDASNPSRKAIALRRVVPMPGTDLYRPADKGAVECIQEFEDYAKEHSSLEVGDDIKLDTYLYFERPTGVVSSPNKKVPSPQQRDSEIMAGKWSRSSDQGEAEPLPAAEAETEPPPTTPPTTLPTTPPSQ